ncbi:unnamed protein product [Lactuca virosa]|uniref:Uncharacterized protein n=1 Tax=Lactuca virosa TaxID=75947 RepID=A0AAU9P7L6_9ASTR|nr:unnamed protein product [Lactuca virosa]
MGNETSVPLKVFVDDKKKKVMFAEAEEDFVEILFSFLTLPLGTIARQLSRIFPGDSTYTKLGSLTSLHESVGNLNMTLFSSLESKGSLVHTINSSAHLCEKLKVNLNHDQRARVFPHEEIFLKKKAKFIITDDLNVVPIVLDKSIELLNSLGVDYIDELQEKTVNFGLKEFIHLLKWSLFTNNSLTNCVLGGRKPSSSFFTNSTLTIPSTSGQIQTQKIKLLIQKSKKKVLCAQVENHFVELLFSFLTIPFGAYERITKDIGSSPLMGTSNLYNSISSLGEYLTSEDVKTMLLCPNIAESYVCVTDLLPIYEVNKRQGSFLNKEQATIFMVSNDLKVTTCPSIATISKFNTHGVPIHDMELLELSIGEQEALLLLKASLTSRSALTDWFRALLSMKKLKDLVPNNDFGVDGGSMSEEEVGSNSEVDSHSDKLSVAGDAGRESEEEAVLISEEENHSDALSVISFD